MTRPPTEINFFMIFEVEINFGGGLSRTDVYNFCLKFTKNLISGGGLVVDIHGRQAEINFGGDIISVGRPLGLVASSTCRLFS